MKTGILALSACALLIATGCSHSITPDLQEVYNMTEQINKALPETVAGFGKWTGVRFQRADTTVVYSFTVDPAYVDLKGIKSDPKAAKVGYASFLTDSQNRSLSSHIADMGGKVTLTFTDTHSRKNTDVTYSSSELSAILKSNGAPTPQARYSAKIELENAGCPQRLEDGMVLMSVTDSAGYAVYTCMLDDSIFNLQEMAADRKDVKEGLSHYFTLPSTRNELSLFTAAGRGVKYVYRAISGPEAVTVTFTPAELKSISRSTMKS